MGLVLSGFVVLAVWIFAFWQWAIMFTNGFWQSTEARYGEGVAMLIVVARCAAIIPLCFGSLALPGLLGLV